MGSGVDTAGSGKRFGYCRKLGEMWILQLVIIGLDTADIRRSVDAVVVLRCLDAAGNRRSVDAVLVQKV